MECYRNPNLNNFTSVVWVRSRNKLFKHLEHRFLKMIKTADVGNGFYIYHKIAELDKDRVCFCALVAGYAKWNLSLQ